MRRMLFASVLVVAAYVVSCAEYEPLEFVEDGDAASLSGLNGQVGGVPPSSPEFVPMPAPCTDPPSTPGGQCQTGLRCAQAYNILLWGDYAGGVDVGGKIAVGGDLTMQSFSVGHQDEGGNVVVAGGDVTLSNGMVHGSVIHGGDAAVSQSVGFGGNGETVPGVGMDFGQCAAQICGTSVQLAQLASSGNVEITEIENGHLLLRLVGNGACFNTFRVDASVLSAAKHLAIDVPAGATVVLNVDGGPLTLSNFGIDYGATDFQQFVINAPFATEVAINSFGLDGSLLACDATVTFNNGQLRGTMVAWNLAGNGEFHDWAFQGCLP
ncbi:MAG: choice-of-anchor A domain-containing protein [Myxococcota bacterium]|jgi:choice-of-anchor A domain-containing protein